MPFKVGLEMNLKEYVLSELSDEGLKKQYLRIKIQRRKSCIQNIWTVS